jgi:glycerol uptake facilitator-like aquaporin
MLPLYLAAQFLGAVLGVLVANLMFELPVISFSQHAPAAVRRNG